MEVNVTNLGPLKKGKMKLGELSVICGSNNSGKTYLAYSVYGFLRYLTRFTTTEIITSEHPILTHSVVDKLVHDGEAVVKIEIEKLLKYYKELFQKDKTEFKTNLYHFFSGEAEDFKGVSVSFKFDQDNAEQLIRNRLEDCSTERIHTATVNYIDDSLQLSTGSNARQINQGKDYEFYRLRLIAEFNNFFFRTKNWRPFIITADRMGISLFHKQLDAYRVLQYEERGKTDREIRKLKEDIMMNKDSKYAKPISHEINFARDLEYVAKKRSELVKGFAPYKWIEDMMGARYKTDKLGTRLISRSTKHGDFDIPLHRASASSRELSHLYHYLKHEAKINDLLVIDEPESHLSSSNQILLSRLICECINCGIRVLLTTHSEIILKEINNMIMLGEYKDRKKIKKALPHYDKVLGIKSTQVQVYYCKDGEMSKCKVDDMGIKIPDIDQTLVRLDDDAVTLSNFMLGFDEDV